jgi:hypothetical protein
MSWHLGAILTFMVSDQASRCQDIWVTTAEDLCCMISVKVFQRPGCSAKENHQFLKIPALKLKTHLNFKYRIGI